MCLIEHPYFLVYRSGYTQRSMFRRNGQRQRGAGLGVGGGDGWGGQWEENEDNCTWATIKKKEDIGSSI